MHIFLDESGNFTKHKHEEYFVVGSFTVGDQRISAKRFISWCHTKFPRKMRTQNEIKWSATGIDEKLRLKTLKYISNLNVHIRYGYFLRKSIPVEYRKADKIQSGILYANIIAETLESYLPTDEKEIHIFCDQRSLKDMTVQEFESFVKIRLLPCCSPGTLITVQMIDSVSNANIQIADWISGALSRYLEKGKNSDEYYKILKNNLLGSGKEFFAE